MCSALPLLFRLFLFAAGHLDHPATGKAPGSGKPVVTAPPTEDLVRANNEFLELRALATENQAFAVGSAGKAEQQVGFAAAGRTTVEEFVSLRMVRQGLRPRQWCPQRNWAALQQPIQAFQPIVGTPQPAFESQPVARSQ